LQSLPVEDRMRAAARFVEASGQLVEGGICANSYCDTAKYVDATHHAEEDDDVVVKALRDLDRVVTIYLGESWHEVAKQKMYSKNLLEHDLCRYIERRSDKTTYDFIVTAINVIREPSAYKAVAALRHIREHVKALAADLVPPGFGDDSMPDMRDVDVFRAVQRIVCVGGADAADAQYWASQMATTFYSIAGLYGKICENRYLYGDAKEISKLALSIDKKLLVDSEWYNFITHMKGLSGMSGPADEVQRELKSNMTTAEMRRYVEAHGAVKDDHSDAHKEWVHKKKKVLDTLLGWLERVCEEGHPLVPRADVKSIIDAAASQALLELLQL
jgi:hypothetical protein